MMVCRKTELAELYSKTARIYRRRYRDIQRKKHELVLSRLPKIGRVLDVGCGTGELLLKMAERAEMVVGVDISPGMLRALPRNLKNIHLIVADADSLPFKSGAFDCVVSVTLLQNMPDPEKTVREMARVVRAGGILIATSLKKKHRREELESWMEKAGLHVEESGEVGEDVYCVCHRSSKS